MQPTRERILHILKERGQVTVDELSQELGLTTVTVRHHLDILRGEGLVSAPLTRRRKAPGRPKHVYTLTEGADAIFPKRYKDLATLLLSEVRTHFSAAEVNEMMTRIGERIASQAILPDGDDFQVRLEAVVEFLNGLGFMTRWEQRDGGEYLIHVANCPYEQVSRHDPEICAMDLAMLTRLLGTSPRRITSMAEGDYQCSYTLRALAE
jgi:predicted ArsR family transcriptional regulator